MKLPYLYSYLSFFLITSMFYILVSVTAQGETGTEADHRHDPNHTEAVKTEERDVEIEVVRVIASIHRIGKAHARDVVLRTDPLNLVKKARNTELVSESTEAHRDPRNT